MWLIVFYVICRLQILCGCIEIAYFVLQLWFCMFELYDLITYLFFACNWTKLAPRHVLSWQRLPLEPTLPQVFILLFIVFICVALGTCGVLVLV